MSIDERLNEMEFPLPAIRQINNAKHASSISLGLGELSEFPVDEKITEALAASLNHKGFTYTQNAGLPQLRQSIAQSQQLLDGQTYSVNNVVVTIGVQNAVYATLKTLSKLGAKRLLIPAINFGIYRKIALEFGMQVSTYSLNADFSIDLLALEKQLHADDVLLINSPANPTGKVFDAKELEQLGELCKLKLNEGYVISDEIYGGLVYDGEAHQSFSKYFPRCLVVNGISKSAAAAGLRVGWVIAPNQKLIQAIVSNNATIISTPPTANQFAAIPVVEGLTQDSIDNYKEELLKNRNRVLAMFKRAHLEVNAPRGSFYIFVDISKYVGTNTQSFCLNLAKKEHGVVLIPGDAFGAPGFVRISLATSQIEEGVNRFLTALGLA